MFDKLRLDDGACLFSVAALFLPLLKRFAMASIVSILNPKMFVSEFVQLEFRCTAASMVFSIRQGQTEIFAQTYYPDENKQVIVYDLDKFLEAHIAEFCAEFSFLIDGTECGTVTVITCRTAVEEPANDFFNDFFFTTSMGERDTAIGRFETVTALTDTETNVDAYCTYLAENGSINSKKISITTLNGRATIDVSPERFCDAESGRLISYIVKAGARKARYRVLSGAPDADPAIIFLNSFGCWETIYLTGSKQTAPSYTRSTALIEGQSRVYDIAEVMSFKARTGPLRPGIVPVAMDLARATDVFLLNADGSSGGRLTITDADVKHTNEDNSIPDFEFTYRRADRRSAVLSVVRPPKIFDDKFDNTYA